MNVSQQSDIIVHRVPPSKKRTAENITRDLVTLLSLATMKKISICEIEYPNGSGNMRRNSAHGFVKSGRPIIDTDQGRRLQQFIDESWVTFRKLKQSRKLFNAALLLTICR